MERGEALRKRFTEIFGHEPATLVRAPGRVNLIGEHTDYNEGYVLPVAIDRHIWMVAAPRPDRQVVLYALDFDRQTEFSLDNITMPGTPGATTNAAWPFSSRSGVLCCRG